MKYILVVLLLLSGCTAKKQVWHMKGDPCDHKLYDCQEYPD